MRIQVPGIKELQQFNDSENEKVYYFNESMLNAGIVIEEASSEDGTIITVLYQEKIGGVVKDVSIFTLQEEYEYTTPMERFNILKIISELYQEHSLYSFLEIIRDLSVTRTSFTMQNVFENSENLLSTHEKIIDKISKTEAIEFSPNMDMPPGKKVAYYIGVVDPFSSNLICRAETYFENAKDALLEGFAITEQLETLYNSEILWDIDAPIIRVSSSTVLLTKGNLLGKEHVEPFYIQISFVGINEEIPYSKPKPLNQPLSQTQNELSTGIGNFFDILMLSENEFSDVHEGFENEEETIMTKEELISLKVSDFDIHHVVTLEDESGQNEFKIDLVRTDQELIIGVALEEHKKYYYGIFGLENYIEALAAVIEVNNSVCLVDYDTESPEFMYLNFHIHYTGNSIKEAIEVAEKICREIKMAALRQLISFSEDYLTKFENGLA